MRIKYILIALLMALGANTHAQLKDEDYRKQASEVRKYVWNMDIKAFNNRNIPEEYKKYSKVIIARHEEITALTRSKINWTILMGAVPQRDLTYTHITRELVKINDAAALEDYSEITFQKFAQQFKNKLTTFLGVRIIKRDGRVTEIDPDEMVLLNNTSSNMRSKLAVSDLQIGDMLDYFIQSVEYYNRGSSIDIENFVFAEKDPVMHYSVHVEASNKIAARYRAVNGAPDFSESVNNNGDMVLDVQKTDIQAFPVDLWMSPYRQLPILRLHLIFRETGSSLRANVPKGGVITRNPNSNAVFAGLDADMKLSLKLAMYSIKPDNNKLKKLAESYITKNGSGKIKDNPSAVFYAVKHVYIMEPNNENVYLVDSRRNYTTLRDRAFISLLAGAFREFDIHARYVLLPSKYGPTLEESMLDEDLELALITDDKHIYTSKTIFDSPNELPFFMEGQQGMLLIDTDGKSLKKGSENIFLAHKTQATQNLKSEDLIYTFDPQQPQKMKVDRRTTLTGLMRTDFQRQLLLFEDFYEEERKALGLENSFYDELKDSRKGKKIVDEYKSAFEEARKQWKDNQKEEITEEFAVSPDEMLSYQIEQSGVFEKKPAMIYTSSFTVNSWIKKAGNNFILDVGKMIGKQLTLRSDQRERKVDIYMPHARSFQYNISIPIPKGYTAEGLEKLNNHVDNSTGAFITSAKLNNQTINISVVKTYKNDYEKVEKWSDLLKMLDSATAFEDSKVMFKKTS